MKVLCTICTELFDGTGDISAVPCGHIFHSDCLSRWLETSLTCPQCRTRVTRKSVVAKLYFSQPDKLDGEVDEPAPSQLVNELETLQANVRQKDFEISRMLAEKLSAEEKLGQAKENFKSLEDLHKQEIAKNKLLKQELVNYQDMQQKACAAKQEASELRKKLVNLHSVQKVINGCEDEIEDMIRQNTDVAQLATWCCVYKRELDRKKADSRNMQELNRKLKKDLEATKSVLSERTSELTSCKEHVKCLEDDVCGQDQQIKSLKNKIEALQAAIASPSNTTTSFARRLINESPAPQLTPSERPKLSRPPVMDLNQSFDLFSSPPKGSSSSMSDHPSQPTATAKRKFSGNESKPKLIKISSASDVRTSEITDISNITDVMHLNILKKKQCSFMANTSSVFRQGFNGLGGREKFIMPLPRPSSISASSFKRSKSMKHQHKSSTSSLAEAPRLPSLNDVDSDS